ncbi:glutamate racemase [Sulfuriroseicoccus oceanibius]
MAGANQPIGILDSGVGGLSVVREIQRLLPAEELLYVGDSAWCPYGTKSAEEIQRRVFAIADALIGRGCKMLVIACNSATIAAVEALRVAYPLPIVGMEPGVRPAVERTSSGVVGVFATEASIRGEKFHRLLDHHADKVRVITKPCPEFVELVEAGELVGERAVTVVRSYVDPMLEEGVDVLVLGCTHYPFLRPLIEAAAGDAADVIDTGAAVARQVQRRLEGEGLLVVSPSRGGLRVFTTGDVAHWQELAPRLLHDDVEVESIAIEEN